MADKMSKRSYNCIALNLAAFTVLVSVFVFPITDRANFSVNKLETFPDLRKVDM